MRNKKQFAVSKNAEVFMRKYNNPLNNIKIASPCSANWDEMYGDDRQRHCSDCKLSVYNLSDMTQTEAENFLINAEGRICIKFYRRTDGTILTKDCPVGWQGLKKRVSRTGTAVFAFFAGLFSGSFVFNQMSFDNTELMKNVTVESETLNEAPLLPIVGETKNLEETKVSVRKTQTETKKQRKATKTNEMVVGQVTNIRRLEDEPVKLWIK